MFNNLDNEINLTCPRCKSSNIYIGIDMKVDPEKTVKCNDCKYSELAYRFSDQHEVDHNKINQ
jgi:transposase-like protein